MASLRSSIAVLVAVAQLVAAPANAGAAFIILKQQQDDLNERWRNSALGSAGDVANSTSRSLKADGFLKAPAYEYQGQLLFCAPARRPVLSDHPLQGSAPPADTACYRSDKPTEGTLTAQQLLDQTLGAGLANVVDLKPVISIPSEWIIYYQLSR
jgi:hypothetical protein